MKQRTRIRTYSDLKKLTSFEDRFNYVKLYGRVGEEIFGCNRYLNQMLYRSPRWRRSRDRVITRDNGCDLGVEGYEIGYKIIVHHMNPITIDDIENDNPDIYDPEFLVCVSDVTHLAIHYGDYSLIPNLPKERRPGDTTLW